MPAPSATPSFVTSTGCSRAVGSSSTHGAVKLGAVQTGRRVRRL
jgi:hypothetical protein